MFPKMLEAGLPEHDGYATGAEGASLDTVVSPKDRDALSWQ